MSAVEKDMTRLREDWKDVAQKPMANARILNSLRETQVEHGRTLVEHSEMLAKLTEDVTELKHGQSMIVNMLTTLIERDE